jgi:hypothetical protein
MLFTAWMTCPTGGDGLEFHADPQNKSCRETLEITVPPPLLVVVLAGASQGE